MNRVKRAHKTFAPVALLFLSLAFAFGCGIEQKRSGLPSEAQALIDGVTFDMSRGDYDKIYTEAADEWRRFSQEESRANLESMRAGLGRTLSRQQVRALLSERPEGDKLVVNYNTKFERGDAMETFTLIRREGRWRLAGYVANALK
ncbi:MAG TPA: DUF4019 domain-containing protein [Pyrinomonadaceae bacterium]|nr:DUF4019 domain-containing protein [Pyrinomonadaceae bacterium]